MALFHKDKVRFTYFLYAGLRRYFSSDKARKAPGHHLGKPFCFSLEVARAVGALAVGSRKDHVRRAGGWLIGTRKKEEKHKQK